MFRVKNLLAVVGLILCFNLAFGAVNDLPTKKIHGTECYYYVVTAGDDIYSIVENLGVSRYDIVRFNAGAEDGVREGMILYFPVEDFPGTRTAETITPDAESFEEYAETTGNNATADDVIDVIEVGDEIPVTNAKEIKVAVCMPFALGSEKMDKTAVYATDFYRGFLMGIDSLRPAYGNPAVTIVAVDCAENDFMKTARAKLENVDIIIAPETQSVINTLGKYGNENGKYVLNVFQTRDSLYLENPYVLQGNIPATQMYAKAIDKFISDLNGAVPVFMENTQGRKDKQAFIETLIAELNRNGIEYKNLSYDGALTSAALVSVMTPGRSYVFVPLSGTLGEFQKFATSLTNYKTKATEDGQKPNQIRLFGYPEYTRFTGDAYDKLKSIGTSIYTRFYNDSDKARMRNVNASFEKRYGTPLPDGVPNQALYGFDIAHWLLNLGRTTSLESSDLLNDKLNDGLQTAYNFQLVRGGGLVNDAVLYVTFSDSEGTKVEVL